MLDDYSFKTRAILIISLTAIAIYLLILFFSDDPGCILPGPITKCKK